MAMLAFLEGASLETVVSLLNEPIEGLKQHAIVADMLYAVALFVSEPDVHQLYARYALLAYNMSSIPNSPEFIVGILGLLSQQNADQPPCKLPSVLQVNAFQTHQQQNPKQLPNEATWLTYSEIQTVANTALLLSNNSNAFERDFLKIAVSQHDYCPVTVDFLFASPLFITCLLRAYPNNTNFQCLEGYLKLQSMPSLGGVYDAMRASTISEPEERLNRYTAAMSGKKTTYANVRIEIAALKDQLLHSIDSTINSVNEESPQSPITSSPSRIGMFSATNTTPNTILTTAPSSVVRPVS